MIGIARRSSMVLDVVVEGKREGKLEINQNFESKGYMMPFIG